MDYEKLNKRLNHMMTYESDDFFVNIDIKKYISDKLYDFQVFHIFNLITAMRSQNVVLDGSDVGTGKTYTSIAICKQLNLKPFIICPKTVMNNWKIVCDIFGVKPLAIVNYESIKNGKFYDINGDIVNCNFINITENGITWQLPFSTIVIFDEVHRCKNPKTLNGKLLLSTKNLRKVLMLSATLTEKLESFAIFGFMLGAYKNIKQANGWIKGMLLEDKTCLNSAELSSINKSIFPNKGSRMRIKELGDKFPSNQVSADTYLISNINKEIVNKAFKDIHKGDMMLKSSLENNNNAQILGELIKARQLLELAKVQIIVDLANDYIENGYSIAIFVSFNKTINQLMKLMNTDCVINGEQSINKRIDNVKKFQSNESHIIICNIAVSEGISLHDELGRPRISFISPPFSSVQLVQSLGRIARVGAKTPALQRIIYCAGTCEEIICNRLKNKLEFLSKLNDNDLINIDLD